MGNACWGSSHSNDEPSSPKGRDKAYSLKNAEGQYKTSAWKNEFVAKNWKEDTLNIWKRPLSALSCHMDLPRLGHKIQIYDGSNQVVSLEDDKDGQSKMSGIRDILVQLATQAGEDQELIQKLQTSFFEYVLEDGSGDSSQQLKRYLEEVIPENSKLYRILCLCHQKIVFPAYYSIKENIHNDLAFKDCRGSWSINIYFGDKSCTVVHSKVQMAKDAMSGEEPEFRFKWELVLGLTGENLENLEEMDVKIAEVETRENLPLATKNNIEAIFQKYYPQD